MQLEQEIKAEIIKSGEPISRIAKDAGLSNYSVLERFMNTGNCNISTLKAIAKRFKKKLVLVDV